MEQFTEDQVRDKAKEILGFGNVENVETGVGQLTTFNQLGFKGISDKPDGWYLKNDKKQVAIKKKKKNSNYSCIFHKKRNIFAIINRKQCKNTTKYEGNTTF